MQSIVLSHRLPPEPTTTAARTRFGKLAGVLAVLLLALAGLGACGKSPDQIRTSFETIEKGSLATDVRQLLGDPERIESSPQIPDLEHWKYNEGRLTVSLLQGRVLGKFDADPTDPTLAVPDLDTNTETQE